MSLERARQAALVQAALRGDEHAREELGALAEEYLRRCFFRHARRCYGDGVKEELELSLIHISPSFWGISWTMW